MSRELDAKVAELVFGWAWVRVDDDQPEAVPYLTDPGPGMGVFYPHLMKRFPNGDAGTMPRFTTDPAADYSVLVRVRETWDFRKRLAFRQQLRVLWGPRRSSGLDANDHPASRAADYVDQYQPGDYSKAALAALGAP